MGTCNNSSNCYFLCTYCCHIAAFALLLSVFLTPPLFVKFGARPPSHGAANTKKKITVTLFIMTIVSLLLWLPYVMFIFIFFPDLHSFLP